MLNRMWLLPITFLIWTTFTFPLYERHELRYHSEAARDQDLPLLTLPYGSYQATKYDSTHDIYTFTNIRFAAPPVGDLRWAKPAPVPELKGIQDGKTGGTCHQSLPPSLVSLALEGENNDVAGSGFASTIIMSFANLVTSMVSSTTVAALLARQDLGWLMGAAPVSEDCLFLDIVVPGKALRGEVKLPVVNWLYGGAYILGAKDVYDGDSIVKASQQNLIFVVANYRLGAFGFLAGDTMEREGTPNAGLWDQRAAMQWIQDHISLVGGDPKQVSVWGESAGAGSIMYHLTAFGGKQPALFKRALIQSPVGGFQYDRTGKLETTFQQYAALAGCKDSNATLACMRSKDIRTLRRANDEIIAGDETGQFGFGPAVDGTIARQLPAIELSRGNTAKNVESIIVTHTTDEGSPFASAFQPTNATYITDTLAKLYDDPDLRKTILERYPPSQPNVTSKFGTEKARYIKMLEAQIFVCHGRYMIDAYKHKSYVGVYGRGNGKHANDVRATFFDPETYVATNDTNFPKFATAYQTYLTSHARSGDPSTFGRPEVKWPKVDPGRVLGNVMMADNSGYRLADGDADQSEECKFWINIWSKASKVKPDEWSWW